MKFKRVGRMVALALAVICTGSLSLWADPPGRIGRINLIQGAVSYHPASLDDWAPATLNYPLTTGDHLWTDVRAQAELHVGSTAIRMADQTEIGFLNLNDDTVQIRLSQGSMNIRLRRLDPDDAYEVDTPDVAVSLLRPGTYRVDVDPQGNTNVVVEEGETEVTANGYSFSVYARQVATINGIDSPTYDIHAAGALDSFDQWCLSRDRREDSIASTRYVSPEMVGYEDLDAYGTWRTVPQYGSIWVPTHVVAGWAPYRYGHWVWVEPWGWTWVDDDPWGFAPFHYGRWVFVGGAWGWIPGAVVARPVYAPALVAFIGGSNWNVSIGVGGGIGWFPLGPHEVFVPAYRVSPTYVRNVNITNVNITNINVENLNATRVNYVNRTIPGAVTVVPQQAFARSESVAREQVQVNNREILTAPISGTTAPVTPRAENVLGRTVTPGKAVPRPPAPVAQRPVVAHMPPPQRPEPFGSRQPVTTQNQVRPVNPPVQQTPRSYEATRSPNVRMAVPQTPVQKGAPPGLRPVRPGISTPRPATTGVRPQVRKETQDTKKKENPRNEVKR